MFQKNSCEIQKNRKRFGHSIDNMWENETDLMDTAVSLWEACKVKDPATKDVDFKTAFMLLSQLHDGSNHHASRYGGVNCFPVEEPLVVVFEILLDQLCREHSNRR